ncbi:amidohydrolase [Virgibacillus natechei]|uniref:Amidohydrolase n=1 Tax=Virgibacillus natechei TaxID=1216297 RepID=A0ABS4IGL8_9BACI|nr:M20 family metallopeptidase [Virgibacillus natechei]MBP1970097.1 amidohydrolase [Virgibacillus natechei]UZD14176.1 M20 family metallopeptidase [Virgibacillus natechei]
MVSHHKEITIRAEKMASQLVQWRRTLHKNPELSFQEVETSRMIAQILEQIPGMHVQVEAGYPTAVVGTLSYGEGPTFAIRADIDALPIEEENSHDYQSRYAGVMHACGHDAHTAIGLGAAHLLSESFENGGIQGTVKFLFQPAEERADAYGSTGAPYMIQAGVLDDVDGVIALHMSPEDQLGEVRVHDGYSMANVDVFKAKISGTGGHGAYPHQGTDPIWMLGSVLQAVYGITSRRLSPLESGVISIGSIYTGVASNVIPSEVDIQGTIRSYHPDVRKVMHTELEKAFSLVTLLGGDYQLEIMPEDPALKNDPVINQLIEGAIQDLYPSFHVLDIPFGLGGEDFAHMTEKVPGAMFFLGCAKDDGEVRNLHTPNFDIDEKSLPIGLSILTETARRFLNR